jgi:hypothetical protein
MYDMRLHIAVEVEANNKKMNVMELYTWDDREKTNKVQEKLDLFEDTKLRYNGCRCFNGNTYSHFTYSNNTKECCARAEGGYDAALAAENCLNAERKKSDIERIIHSRVTMRSFTRPTVR